jgi:predicted anti-sigma-YlaC factor YlaD
MDRCKEFTELVTDYLEGQLEPAQQVSVSRHLTSCQHCRVYLEQMKSLVKLLRQLGTDPPHRSSRLGRVWAQASHPGRPR